MNLSVLIELLLYKVCRQSYHNGFIKVAQMSHQFLDYAGYAQVPAVVGADM